MQITLVRILLNGSSLTFDLWANALTFPLNTTRTLLIHIKANKWKKRPNTYILRVERPQSTFDCL